VLAHVRGFIIFMTINYLGKPIYPRDNKGRFTRKAFRWTLALFFTLLISGGIFYGHTSIMAWIDEKQEEVQYKAEVKDNIQKLTENLDATMRELSGARAMLDRATKAQQDATDLYNSAIADYNTAIESIDLYNNGM